MTSHSDVPNLITPMGEQPTLQLTVGINNLGRLMLDFNGASIQRLELEPAAAIEIANALIGNAFMIIQQRTLKSENLEPKGESSERPN